MMTSVLCIDQTAAHPDPHRPQDLQRVLEEEDLHDQQVIEQDEDLHHQVHEQDDLHQHVLEPEDFHHPVLLQQDLEEQSKERNYSYSPARDPAHSSMLPSSTADPLSSTTPLGYSEPSPLSLTPPIVDGEPSLTTWILQRLNLTDINRDVLIDSHATMTSSSGDRDCDSDERTTCASSRCQDHEHAAAVPLEHNKYVSIRNKSNSTNDRINNKENGNNNNCVGIERQELANGSVLAELFAAESKNLQLRVDSINDHHLLKDKESSSALSIHRAAPTSSNDDKFARPQANANQTVQQPSIDPSDGKKHRYVRSQSLNSPFSSPSVLRAVFHRRSSYNPMHADKLRNSGHGGNLADCIAGVSVSDTETAVKSGEEFSLLRSLRRHGFPKRRRSKSESLVSEFSIPPNGSIPDAAPIELVSITEGEITVPGGLGRARTASGRYKKHWESDAGGSGRGNLSFSRQRRGDVVTAMRRRDERGYGMQAGMQPGGNVNGDATCLAIAEVTQTNATMTEATRPTGKAGENTGKPHSITGGINTEGYFTHGSPIVVGKISETQPDTVMFVTRQMQPQEERLQSQLHQRYNNRDTNNNGMEYSQERSVYPDIGEVNKRRSSLGQQLEKMFNRHAAMTSSRATGAHRRTSHDSSTLSTWMDGDTVRSRRLTVSGDSCPNSSEGVSLPDVKGRERASRLRQLFSRLRSTSVEPTMSEKDENNMVTRAEIRPGVYVRSISIVDSSLGAWPTSRLSPVADSAQSYHDQQSLCNDEYSTVNISIKSNRVVPSDSFSRRSQSLTVLNRQSAFEPQAHNYVKSVSTRNLSNSRSSVAGARGVMGKSKVSCISMSSRTASLPDLLEVTETDDVAVQVSRRRSRSGDIYIDDVAEARDVGRDEISGAGRTDGSPEGRGERLLKAVAATIVSETPRKAMVTSESSGCIPHDFYSGPGTVPAANQRRRRSTLADLAASVFSRKSQNDPKKLATRLFDSKKDVFARLRQLKTITEQYGPKNAKEFYQLNFSFVYALFYDGFTSIESALSGKTRRDDVDILLYIFRKLLSLLPELVYARWQFHSIGRTMQRLLHIGNALRVREEGTRLFILWYAILMDNASDECHAAFRTLVAQLTTPAELVKTGKGSTSSDSGSQLTNDDQVEGAVHPALALILQAMVTQVSIIEWSNSQLQFSSFYFLVDKFKQFYLSDIFTSFKVIDIYDVHNIELSSCSPTSRPPNSATSQELLMQETLIVWLSNFTGTDKQLRPLTDVPFGITPDSTDAVSPPPMTLTSSVSVDTSESGANTARYTEREFQIVKTVLFCCRENVVVILEILHQAFLASLQRVSITRCVLAIYEDWFQADRLLWFMLEPDNGPEATSTPDDANDDSTTMLEVRVGLQKILQIFIAYSMSVFMLDWKHLTPLLLNSAKGRVILDEQMELCRRTLSVYRYMAMNINMTEATWSFILRALLRITSHILDTGMTKYRTQPPAGRLAQPLLQMLMVMWVRGCVTVPVSKVLWDELLAVLSSLTDWVELVNEWARTMNILTGILSRVVYGVDLRSALNNHNNISNMAITDNNNGKPRRHASRVTGPHEEPESLQSPDNNGGYRVRFADKATGLAGQDLYDETMALYDAKTRSIRDSPHSVLALRRQTQKSRNSGSIMNGGVFSHSPAPSHLSSSTVSLASVSNLPSSSSDNPAPLSRSASDGNLADHVTVSPPVTFVDFPTAASDVITSSQPSELPSQPSVLPSRSSMYPAQHSADLLVEARKNGVAGHGMLVDCPVTGSGLVFIDDPTPNGDDVLSSKLSPKTTSVSTGYASDDAVIEMIRKGSRGESMESSEQWSRTSVDTDDTFSDFSPVPYSPDTSGGPIDLCQVSLNSATGAVAYDSDTETIGKGSTLPDHGETEGIAKWNGSGRVRNIKRGVNGFDIGGDGRDGRGRGVGLNGVVVREGGDGREGLVEDARASWKAGGEGRPRHILLMNERVEKSSAVTAPSRSWSSEMGLPDDVTVILLWHRMLGALGNVNVINNPETHAIVIDCLASIAESLLKIYGCSDDTNTASDLTPPIHLLVPWFFEVLNLSDKFMKSKLVAYRQLCAILLRRDQPVFAEHLVRFCFVLHAGLAHSRQEIVNVLVKNCVSRFFGLAWPGTSLLVLDFIHAATSVITVSASSTQAPKLEAVTLLGSLISFSNHYGDIPALEPVSNEVKVKTVDSSLLKDCIINVLLSSAAGRNLSTVTSCVRCSCLGLYVFEELVHDTFHSKLSDAINSLLNMITEAKDVSVCQMAIDMMSMLSTQVNKILATYPALPARIITEISGKIVKCLSQIHTSEPASNRSCFQIMNSALFCLLEWCMNLPPATLLSMTTATATTASSPASSSSSSRIFLSRILRVLYAIINLEPATYDADINSNYKEERSRSVMAKSPSAPVLRQRTFSRASNEPEKLFLSNEAAAEYAANAFNEEMEFRRLKIAAKTILNHVLCHVAQYPMKNNAGTDSTVLECHDLSAPGGSVDELSTAVLDRDHVQFFLLNDDAVLTLIELPAKSVQLTSSTGNAVFGSGAISRVIVRDLSGKHCWDLESIYKRTANHTFTSHTNSQPIMFDVTSCANDNEGSQLAEDVISCVDQHPRFVLDLLDILLEEIGTTASECRLYPDESLNEPYHIPPSISQATDDKTVRNIIDQFIQIDEFLVASDSTIAINSSNIEDSILQNAFDTRSTEQKLHGPDKTSCPFRSCRQFLRQFGLVDDRRQTLQLLKQDEKLIRELRHLDAQICRETHKIAVIYVADGQNDKVSILSNSTGSLAYEQFLAGLGWMVDLSTHEGFLGGFQKTNSSTFKNALYYASSTTEVIYHVATAMPSDKDDDRHKKLKHLGNDEVHVVWSEHSTLDYRQDVIPTQFGDVIIVIYPLDSGLFRIEILLKDESLYFGPLFDGVIVDAFVLPGLVKATAINASRRLRSNKPFYKPFYEERASSLHNISSRCVRPTIYEEFMSEIISPNKHLLSMNLPIYSTTPFTAGLEESADHVSSLRKTKSKKITSAVSSPLSRARSKSTSAR